jgi:hypothetical protein
MATLAEGTLTLDEGETFRFPADEGTDVAAHQEVRTIRSLEDVQHFQFVRELAAFLDPLRGVPQELPRLRQIREEDNDPLGRPSFQYLGSLPRGADLLGFVREIARGELFELSLADFVIPSGSTAIFTSPLTQIYANRVTIQGTLRASGDVAVVCNEIRGV